MWLEHLDTSVVTQQAWSKGLSLVTKLKNTKNALKEWNAAVFENVHQKIKLLCNIIDNIQNQSHTPALLEQERNVTKDLTNLEQHATTFWRERSKSWWLEEGDSNSHYFHVTTLIHRRHNCINYIVGSSNNWIQDRERIGREFEDYFQNIFTTVHLPCTNVIQELIIPVINDADNMELIGSPTALEVHQTILSMGNYKSLSSDDTTTTFYKHY